MLILCNIFVKLEHFILFNNFDVPQLHVLQDKHKLYGSKAIHVNIWPSCEDSMLSFTAFTVNVICFYSVLDLLMKALVCGKEGFGYLARVLVILLKTLLQDKIAEV